MNCIQAQVELVTPGGGVVGWFRSRMSAQHQSRCADCRDFAVDAKSFEAEAHALYSGLAPDFLRNRIATALSVQVGQQAATISAGRERGSASIRMGIAVKLQIGLASSAIGLLVMSFFLGGPLLVVPPAIAVAKMEQAVAAVKSAHFLCYGNDSQGHLSLADEEWFQNGKWRKQGDSGTRIIAHGTWYRYNASSGKLMSSRETGRQWDEFSLGSLEHDFIPDGQESQEQDLEQTSINGNDVTEVSLTRSGDAGVHHILFYIDLKTDLPVRIQTMNLEGGVWNVGTRYDFDFNTPYPSWMFDPKLLR